MLSILRIGIASLAIIILQPSLVAAPKSEPIKLFWSTFANLETDNTIAFKMKFQEFEPSGEKVCKVGYFKIQKSPFELYYRQESPEKGMELLYAEGANSNKILIHKNGFPWITFSLDPLGNLMLKQSRHPIFEAGYWYLAEVVKYIMASSKQAHVVYEGEDSCMGRDCMKFLVDNPSYAIETYTTKRGETLYSIAKARHLYLYTLRMLNPDVDINSIPEQTLLRLPSSYARKMIILIDKEKELPLKIQIYNENSLMEEMEFTNVIINARFSSDDFSKCNPSYSF